MERQMRGVISINDKKTIDNNTNDDIILYTPQDIQRIFMCSKNQAYTIIHSSGFPKLQIGRKIYVPKDKLEKWINVNTGKKIKI